MIVFAGGRQLLEVFLESGDLLVVDRFGLFVITQSGLGTGQREGCLVSVVGKREELVVLVLGNVIVLVVVTTGAG